MITRFQQFLISMVGFLLPFMCTADELHYHSGKLEIVADNPACPQGVQPVDDGSVLVAEHGRAWLLSLRPIGKRALSSVVTRSGNKLN